MTEQHPMLPTNKQFAEWDSEYFEEDQNFDIMMIKAFQAGADQQLRQVIEWVEEKEYDQYWHKEIIYSYDLKKAMRPATKEES